MEKSFVNRRLCDMQTVLVGKENLLEGDDVPALYTLCNFCKIVNSLILPRFGLWSSSVAAIKRDVLSLQC